MIMSNTCNLSIFNQQTISAENAANVTSQLQTVVSQAIDCRVDQSTSNLDIVATVDHLIANISSSTDAPVQKKVTYEGTICC